MAHLTKPTTYDIQDSNIALLGSDLEKHVREHAGDKDPAWASAGTSPGLQIWRIEQFRVAPWPAERYGSFYDGDSYIVLHTYKPAPDADALAHDLHFWLGAATTQDEAGTAAYKTVELDDHLGGRPVQYREAQGYESSRFLGYFARFTSLRGGAATGFHHVSAAPPPDARRLYRVSTAAGGRALLVREVSPAAASLVAGDAYVLDAGAKVWQFSTAGSAGRERFRASELVRELADARPGTTVTVYDEGQAGAGAFLALLGADAVAPAPAPSAAPPALFRVSDASGAPTFAPATPVSRASLAPEDAFLLDASGSAHPAVYVWLGGGASLKERRLAGQYAQRFVHERRGAGEGVSAGVVLVKVAEGGEPREFWDALGA